MTHSEALACEAEFLAVSNPRSQPLLHSHPISVGDYYEDQKVEAHKRSIDFRKARLPKFLSSVFNFYL